MTKRRRRPALPLPLLLAELSAASWETVLRRTAMMAEGSCSAAEYQRMVLEKAEAVQHTMLAMMFPGSTSAWHAALAPWHRAARANARRLRRRQ